MEINDSINWLIREKMILNEFIINFMFVIGKWLIKKMEKFYL